MTLKLVQVELNLSKLVITCKNLSEMVQIDQKSTNLSKLVKTCAKLFDFTKLQTLELMNLQTYKNLQSELFVHL